MTELDQRRAETVRGGEPPRLGRLRRPVLLLLVTLLCGAAYLAGIWTGTKAHITCTTITPGRLECSSGAPGTPTQPPLREPEQGSA